jgi:hypothetical protein
MLIDAKKAVPHGDWADLVSKLEFDESTAQRLMKIARDPRLSNPAILPLLPQQWTQLYALSKCKTDEHFERKLSEIGQPRTARPKPTVTDAEYHDVTESPVARPGDAVSDIGVGANVPGGRNDIESGTPHDDREGGDSVVTEQDATGAFARESAEAEPALEPSMSGAGMDVAAAPSQPDRSRSLPIEGNAAGHSLRPPHPEMVAYWVDPNDPMSLVVTGIAMAMSAIKRTSPEALVELWPPDMPLLSNDFDEFASDIMDTAELWRKRHGNGNDAALESAAE